MSPGGAGGNGTSGLYVNWNTLAKVAGKAALKYSLSGLGLSTPTGIIINSIYGLATGGFSTNNLVKIARSALEGVTITAIAGITGAALPEVLIAGALVGLLDAYYDGNLFQSTNPPTVSKPGFAESLIPIWGSGKEAIYDFQTGHWAWGLVQTGLAISDVFLVKSLVRGWEKRSSRGQRF